MRTDRPPYIGNIKRRDWITQDKRRIDGIRLVGASGIAAHLTPDEAYSLADKLVDLADTITAEQPPATTKDTLCESP